MEESQASEDILSVIDDAPQPDAGDTGDSGDNDPVDSPTTETGDVQSEESADASGDGEEGEGQARKGDGVQKRINELTRKAKEAAREAREERDARIAAETRAKAIEELTAAKAGQEPPVDQVKDPEPKEEQFNSLEDFERAHRRWEIRDEARRFKEEQDSEARKADEQERKRKAAEEVERQVVEFVESATKRFPTFKESVGPIVDILDSSNIGSVARQLDEGPDVLMYLAKKPEEARRIAALSPIKQAVEIGALSQRIRDARAERKTTKAGEPISPVGNRTAPSTKDPEKMSDQEWYEQEKAKKAKAMGVA